MHEMKTRRTANGDSSPKRGHGIDVLSNLTIVRIPSFIP